MNSLVNNPNIANNIAKMHIEGYTQEEIAKEFNVSQPAISKALGHDKLKAIIQKAYDDIASLAPYVSQVYAEEIKREPRDRFDRRIRLDVAAKIGDITGLSPVRDSRNSVFLANILTQNNIAISPVVAELLSKWGASKPSLPSEAMPTYEEAELVSE